jgi:hypothetical protein
VIVVWGVGGSARAVFADHVEEELVNPAVVRELRVEGRCQHASRADEDRVVVAACKNLDTGANTADAWRADEDHLHWASGDRCVGVKDDGVVLAAVGIALDIDVENAEAALWRVGHVLREEDAAGAGTEDRLGTDEFIEDRVKAGAFEVFEEGGGFATGEHQGVDRGELIGLANEVRGGAEFGETLGVDVEGALEGQDSDPWGVIAHSLRVAASCSRPVFVPPR